MKPPSDMYQARPFELTRYAVPNERCQRRLHLTAAGSTLCTKIYHHRRLLIVEESKKIRKRGKDFILCKLMGARTI